MPAAHVSPLFLELFDIQPSKGDRRKLAILEGCMGFVQKEGLQALSLERLARHLKITRAHVVYYFGDVDHLLLETSRYCLALSQEFAVQKLKDADTPEKRLQVAVSSWFDWLEDMPECVGVTLAFYHCCSVNPSFEALQAKVQKGGVERLSAALEELPRFSRRRGRGEPFLRELATELQSVVYGCLLEHFSAVGKKKISHTRERALEMVRRLVESA